MKSRRLVDYEFPYALLISKIIKHFGIKIDDEVTGHTSARRNSQITKKHIEKLGMKKIGDRWLMTGEGPALDDDEMEAALAQAEQQAAPKWSPFETLMIQKMDAILHLHQEHAADVHSSLESIHTRLNTIEARLAITDLDETTRDD